VTDFSPGPIVPSSDPQNATILGGATELSNTDVGQSMVELMLAAQQFRANAGVFQTADHLLDELVHLRRSR
jgi:flagellar hook protein FlgE